MYNRYFGFITVRFSSESNNGVQTRIVGKCKKNSTIRNSLKDNVSMFYFVDGIGEYDIRGNIT